MSLFKKQIQEADAARQAERTVMHALQKTAEEPAVANNMPVKMPKVPETVDAGKVREEYEMYKAAMDADLAVLKTKEMKEIALKLKYKAEALERTDYIGHARAYVDAGMDLPNHVLVWLFIWLVDLCRWDDVFEFLPTMIKTKQKLPPGAFNTDKWMTFVSDYLYDAGGELLEQGRDAIESSGIRDHLWDLLHNFYEAEDQGVVALVEGKVYVMAAKLENECCNHGYAFDLASKAFVVAGAKAGVKKLLGELGKKVGKISPQP